MTFIMADLILNPAGGTSLAANAAAALGVVATLAPATAAVAAPATAAVDVSTTAGAAAPATVAVDVSATAAVAAPATADVAPPATAAASPFIYKRLERLITICCDCKSPSPAAATTSSTTATTATTPCFSHGINADSRPGNQLLLFSWALLILDKHPSNLHAAEQVNLTITYEAGNV